MNIIRREYLLLLIGATLLFLALATTFGDRGFVGSYGAFFSNLNREYFGYIAQVYLILLLYPLYRLYKSPKIDLRRVELILAVILLFASALIFQAVVLGSDTGNGKIGYGIVQTLMPIIGIAGVWIFLIMIMILAITIIFDISIDEAIEFTKKRSALYFGDIKDEFRAKKDDLLDDDLNILRLQKESEKEKSSSKDGELPPIPNPNLNKQNSHSTPEPYRFEDIIEQKDDEVASDIDASNHSLPDFDNVDESIYENKIKIIKQEDKEEQVKIIEEQKPQNIKEQVKSQENQVENQVEKSEENKEEKVVEKYSTIATEVEENRELLDGLDRGGMEKPKDFKLPSTTFLTKADGKKVEIDESEIDLKIEYLLDKLHRFKIEGDVVRTYVGPVVTTFEFKPAPHIKVSKILTLEDDLAMALRAKTIRIQAPVPGKDVVGIEIPNSSYETIYLRDVLEDPIFKEASSPLTIALGKDIVGKPFVTDLKKLPHLLIAGTTGSGKSVGINSMILSLLFRNSPDTLKLLMIDPKMLEFSIYNDIPHLLTPVITQPKKAVVALNNMVLEMERRNDLMSRAKTKNIENYNQKAKKEEFDPFPYIVVIIDELADLMMTSGKDVEHYIARLAQMARASGIHLIVATQRPSVDVVTGLIKANLPSRISYKVGQKIDSKVILDSFGAESLLGRGDMLFTPPGMSGLVRLHAPWSSEDEIEKIVEFIKSQRAVDYDNDFLSEESDLAKGKGMMPSGDDLDELFEDAKEIVINEKKTSISYIQRRLQIGYNRAARIVEQLESMGVLSEPNTKGNRELL